MACWPSRTPSRTCNYLAGGYHSSIRPGAEGSAATAAAAGFYPWRDAPTILRPVPLWLTASVIFMCAVIAHLSTSALLGKRRADRSPWKTLPVAFVLFMLLRSFVAVVVFRVLDPARHLP